MTDTTGQLAKALSSLQAELPKIEKSETAEVETKTGRTYSYTYAGLAAISDHIMPLLSKHGLSFIAKPAFVGDRFVLAYSLLHSSGEREDGQYPLPTSGTPQAIGSAITYGRRYCLCAVTGVAPEDDDDGAAAEAERSAKRGTAQRATPTRPAQKQAARSQPRRTTTAPTPPLPDEEPTEAERIVQAQHAAERAADRISQKQLGMLHASFSELGITDRDAGLAYISDVIGGDVESSKDLTKKQASAVIDRLQKDLEKPFGDKEST